MKSKKILFKLFIGILIVSLTTSPLAINVKSAESEVKKFQMENLEAQYVKDALPEKFKASTTILAEQNAILAEGTPSDLRKIEEYISQIDKPFKQVELEVRVIELSRNALKNLKIFKDTGFLIGSITRGLSVFDFSPSKWSVFNTQLSYLESIGVAQVHAYPKLLSISGRTATININTNNNLVLGSAVGANTGGINIGVAQTQRLDKIIAGTNLSIIPTVGSNNLINTKIGIEVSDNTGTTTQNNVTLPTVTTRREITTDIQVKDGQTVAIGGLIVNNRSVNRIGLPFLTSIPIIGDFLSNRNKQNLQTELVILITPRIKDVLASSITLRDDDPDQIESNFYDSVDGKPIPKKKRKFFTEWRRPGKKFF